MTTPCTKNCEIGEYGLCKSCWRSLDEISKWRSFPENIRSLIMQCLNKRKEHYTTGKLFMKCCAASCFNEADPDITMLSPWGDVAFCPEHDKEMLDLFEKDCRDDKCPE